jgi:hypothetical protein
VDWHEWSLAGRASVCGGRDGRGDSFTTFRHSLPSPDGWTREEDCVGYRDWDRWMSESKPCFETVDANVQCVELPSDLTLRGIFAPLGTDNVDVIVERGLRA